LSVDSRPLQHQIGEMRHGPNDFENLDVYRLSEALSDHIWDLTKNWDNFARDTIGKQLVRAADSIGANIAEGTGRGAFQDNRRFVRIARASLHETKHWLRRAHQRRLLTREQINILKPLVDELAPRLNAYLSSIGRKADSQRITDNGQRT